jgi:hypothetical protein
MTHLHTDIGVINDDMVQVIYSKARSASTEMRAVGIPPEMCACNLFYILRITSIKMITLN